MENQDVLRFYSRALPRVTVGSRKGATGTQGQSLSLGQRLRYRKSMNRLSEKNESRKWQ